MNHEQPSGILPKVYAHKPCLMDALRAGCCNFSDAYRIVALLKFHWEAHDANNSNDIKTTDAKLPPSIQGHQQE